MTDDPREQPHQTDDPDTESAWDMGLQAVYGSEADLVEDDDDAHSILETLEARLGTASRVLLPDADAAGDSPAVFTKEGEAEGRRIGRYLVLGEIARGGMGVVLRGRDVDLGRDVAMKVLKTEHANRRGMVQRFVEEAQIGGQLQHPGVVPVYEMGLDAKMRPYFAMKLVNGRTFSALLNERQDPTQDRGRCLQVFEQICQTIAYAHSRNVIHRDVKPANVMVGAFGEVQVFDWGFAKVLTRGGIEDERAALRHDAEDGNLEIETVRSDSPGSQSLAGSVLGTPSYMPPEQAIGDVEALDERADVFALGAILCEILTGKPPYVRQPGSNIMEQARAGSLDDAYARLSACRGDAELIELAMRCLSASRDDRPRHGGLVAKAMEDHLAHAEERTQEAQVAAAEARVRATEERKARFLTGGFAALLLILICGGVGFAWWRQSERAQDDRDIRAALDDMHTLVRASAWDAAREALERADLVATSGDISDEARADLENDRAEFRSQLAVAQAKQRETQFIDQLRAIHTRPVEIETDDEHDYAKAFREFGIDVIALDSETAAKEIRARGVTLAEEMAFALDDWGARLRAAFRPQWRHMVRTASLADPHPWRQQLRDATLDYDESSLLLIAGDLRPRDRDPRSVCLLAIALRYKQREVALSVLRDAFHVYPNDFWINFYIGYTLARGMRGGWESRGRKVDPERLDEALRHTLIALSHRPGTVSIRNHLANLYQLKEEPDEALLHMAEAVRLDPNDRKLRRGLAHLLIEQGDLAWARTEMAAYLGEPDESSFRVRSAIVQYTERLAIRSGVPLPQIVKDIRERLDDTERTQPELQRQLAIALYRSADWDGAANALRTALAQDAKDLDARGLLMRCLLRQGHFDEAHRVGLESHEHGDDRPELAMLLRRATSFAETAGDIDSLVHGETPPSGSSAIRLARVLLRQGRYTRAATLFTSAWSERPRGRDRRRGESGEPSDLRDAVSALARAGCGIGEDWNEIDDETRTAFRQRALAWLTADLDAAERRTRRSAFSALEGWIYDVRLECVRNAAAITRLSDTEAEAWTAAWARADALLRRERR